MSNIMFLHTTAYVVINYVNPFKPNGIANYYQLDKSISVLRDFGWYFSSLFKVYLHLCPRVDFHKTLRIINSTYTSYENIFIQLNY